MICPRCKQLHAISVACPPGAGSQVGEYELVKELGRGASGVVFLAQHQQSGLEVALKVTHRTLVGDEVHARRVLREARLAEALGAEHVVHVRSASADDPALGPWMVMERVHGETLLELARQRVPAEEALRLLVLTAETLAEAHARQIVHAALKPSNVLRATGEAGPGAVLLLPFGVRVGELDEDEALEDRDVDGFGSAELRPPEQTAGEPADPRMDVYALGGIAYLLATGRMPFNAPTPQALERAHADVVPIAPHRVNPRISRGWSLAIMRALEKQPDQRFQSMAELAQALRDAPAAPDASGMTTGVFLRSSLKPATTAALSTVGVVVLGGEPEPAEAPAPPPPPPPAAPLAAGLADGFTVTSGPIGAGAQAYQPILTPAPSTPSAAMGLVLRATVTDEKGQALGDFTCGSVTRSGLVVCTSGALPRLMSQVKLVFPDLDGLACDAQVVQHISPEQAAQWRMSPGFGVAFGALTPEQRERLEAAERSGVRKPETPSMELRRPDDPFAAEVLRRYSAERAVDGYAMLGLSKAAPFEAIRERVREAMKALEDLVERPLSAAQIKALPQAKERVDELGRTLCDPKGRLEYDAARGNFEGVARCISTGMSVSELEAARARFLEGRPGLAGKSNGFLLAAQTQESMQQLSAALQTYSDVLKTDPLNLTAHQRYQAARRRLDGA